MPYALLDDRAVLSVTGETAATFLQTLVTADVEAVAEGEARPAALLTPQGKILFDFLLSRRPDGFALDVAAKARPDLAKRLALYRLRAKVAIESPDDAVYAVWGEASDIGLADMRFSGGGVRRVYGQPPEGIPVGDAADYESMRIRAGVAEAERDFPASDVFPHDVLLDQNGGVSFRKGCFVGQEVVSRMQHRGTARRRLVLVAAERHLTPGSNVLAGEKPIGTVLSATGRDGMAMVRIDRLAAALRADETLSADGVPLEATIPPWAGYTLPEDGAGDTAE